MSEDQNPFIHPAQKRFQELLDEAEELALEQTAAQPLHDPLQPYHVAGDWGVEPWVSRMVEVDKHVATLRSEATTVAPSSDVVSRAFMEVAVGALQALILFEESEHADKVLDDLDLADFLDKLVGQLDTRIGNLRRQAGGTAEDHTQHVHMAFSPPPTGEEEMAAQEPDPDVLPGLAFTGAHGSVVAGEGPVQDPPAGATVPAEEVDPTTADQSHDFARVGDRPENAEPVDLDEAERALAREAVALRRSAAGSSSAQLGGRHMADTPTDPDMGATGRRARDEEV